MRSPGDKKESVSKILTHLNLLFTVSPSRRLPIGSLRYQIRDIENFNDFSQILTHTRLFSKYIVQKLNIQNTKTVCNYFTWSKEIHLCF